MATLNEVMARARHMIAENPKEATALGAVYKFVLKGDGGGTFLINLKDNPGVTEADGEANCTVKMAVSDFIDVAERRVDSRLLFFAGKMSVEGDMVLALKLKKVLLALV